MDGDGGGSDGAGGEIETGGGGGDWMGSIGLGIVVEGGTGLRGG